MGLLSLVTSVALVVISVFIFLLKQEQLTKLNLSRNWSRGIAMAFLLAGLWLLLQYFSEKTTNNIISDVMKKIKLAN
jgi:4-amino-4-deoxy-L-arabinose transferase-like glycosyltransferase